MLFFLLIQMLFDVISYADDIVVR